ncbi:MAG: ATP-binding protein [Muribaculaceae bacterium]|nr:ATP-binding protein [Muribaculaceae bacterium]
MMNPFITRGYAGPEFFCDREKETRDIIDLITNGNNIALISPRRLGKTDLIRHCFAHPELKDDYYTFLIDIYSTSSLRDFVNMLGKAILEELKPRGRKAWEKFLTMLQSLKAEVSFDFSGTPVWGMGLSSIDNPSTTLDEIFQYLSQADKPCIVAIDEFQQIASYPDGEAIEAMLRTHIQQCANATFIFSGSRRHLMGKMFSSPSRPFYQSVITMGLAPIACNKYAEFCNMMFAKHDKAIEKDVVEKVYEKFDGVTLCLQRVMNVLFMNTPTSGTATVDMVDEAVDYLLNLLNDNFETMLSQLPEKQRAVLFAIAQEGVVKSISSGAFNKRHHLLSPSSTIAATKALIDKDYVASEKGNYYVYDRFFALWLRERNK